jgi:protease-4
MPTPSKSRFGWLLRTLRGLWWLLDGSRRLLLNGLFLALLVALAWALLRSGAPSLQDKTALVLALQGPVHEQFHGRLRDSALQQLRGEASAQTRLRDVLAVLDAAATDPKITSVVLMLDDFAGAGLPSLRELAAAVERFKASGKPVVAWASAYEQRPYYLAAHASEVWLHPMGAVQIEGFGGYRNYYKDALDRLGVTAHVLRAGQYKNAGESFVANAPSPQTLEADALLYGALWARYTAGVEQARKLPAGSLMRALDELPERLSAAGGDLARLALQEKLVDALKTRDELRAAMVERGAKDGTTFRQIGFEAYLAHVKPRTDGDAVGVVVAEGAIVDGEAAGGTVGGLSTAELIRRARDDEKIKALVLRVDSPGGSAFGSELVRRELELTRQAGKPVVVSMGDLAASGGYWIAMAADEVIADETTITGSIGVVAVLPTAEKLLDNVGVRTGGTTTGWLVGAYDARRGLDPRFEQVVQASIDHVYADFTTKVAAARKTTPEKIDAVAQGRVWTGAQAQERGLVDRTGSLGDALAAAAGRAGLDEGWRVQYVEPRPGRTERLLAFVGGAAVQALGLDLDTITGLPGLPAVPGAALQAMQADLAWLAAVSEGRRPFAAQTHCLCAAP